MNTIPCEPGHGEGDEQLYRVQRPDSWRAPRGRHRKSNVTRKPIHASITHTDPGKTAAGYHGLQIALKAIHMAPHKTVVRWCI